MYFEHISCRFWDALLCPETSRNRLKKKFIVSNDEQRNISIKHHLQASFNLNALLDELAKPYTSALKTSQIFLQFFFLEKHLFELRSY